MTPRPARLLLAVDQAERLFTEAPKDADAFAALLQALAGGVAYVVMVMRADAYARFQACAPLLALRAAGATFDLIPPTAAELEDIVAAPGRRLRAAARVRRERAAARRAPRRGRARAATRCRSCR